MKRYTAVEQTGMSGKRADGMQRSRHIDVVVNLDRVRANAEAIRRRTKVPLIAVVKADAYGLGAERIADALAGVADDLAYFSLAEARELGRPGLVLGPPEGDPVHYRELGLRPTIFTCADAQRFAGQRYAVCVDIGMQRFGAPPDELEELLALGVVTELFSHALTLDGVRRFCAAVAGLKTPADCPRHVASSALLAEPEAWLDGVRPGLALYEDALRVSTRLYSSRATHGPAGYTGFSHPQVGIVLAGYSNGLRPAPVLVNGRRQRILEVGMNSSFISLDPADRAGDEVLLLAPELGAAEIGAALGCRPHEVLCRYAALGVRHYAPCRTSRAATVYS